MTVNNSNVKKKNNEVSEKYEVSRTYKMKKSTLKKLYQIKANEDDFNTKFNVILDSAILYYYNKIFNE